MEYKLLCLKLLLLDLLLTFVCNCGHFKAGHEYPVWNHKTEPGARALLGWALCTGSRKVTCIFCTFVSWALLLHSPTSPLHCLINAIKHSCISSFPKLQIAVSRNRNIFPLQLGGSISLYTLISSQRCQRNLDQKFSDRDISAWSLV